MKRIKFRPSLRDQRLAVAHQLAFMAPAAPEHKREAAQAFADEAMASVGAAPKRRVPKDGVDIDRVHGEKRAIPRQLEAPVVQAIGELLAKHPKVLFAVRQNSGMASYEAKSGRYAPVFFYRILTGQPATITDFWGILRDGRPFAIEAKAPGFKEPRTEREFKQANFLMLIVNVGGVGIFATDAQQVADILSK